MLAFSFPVITVYKVGIKLLNPLGRAELLFVLYHVLKFLSRNFQGCCLLFNYQGSMPFVVSLATAILDYHISHRLSTTFFTFFRFLFYLHFTAFPENSIAYLRQALMLSPSTSKVNPIF